MFSARLFSFAYNVAISVLSISCNSVDDRDKDSAWGVSAAVFAGLCLLS